MMGEPTTYSVEDKVVKKSDVCFQRQAKPKFKDIFMSFLLTMCILQYHNLFWGSILIVELSAISCPTQITSLSCV